LEEAVIKNHGWMSQTEFIDIFAISEMTPGPIAVNAATFVGYRVAGVLGSAVATMAVILPSFIIISLIFIFLNKFKNSPYVDWIFKGIRPVILGLIASAGVTVAQSSLVDLKSILLGAGIFYFVTFKRLNPIYGIIISGIIGWLFF